MASRGFLLTLLALAAFVLMTRYFLLDSSDPADMMDQPNDSAVASNNAVSSAKTFVVAIAPFYGPDDDSAKEGQRMAYQIEKSILEKLGSDGVKVIGKDDTKQVVRTPEAAIALGGKFSAGAVIWGEALATRSETEIQPHITLPPEHRDDEPAAASGGILGSLLKSPAQDKPDLLKSAEATLRMKNDAPSQIELQKTTARDIGNVVVYLAGVHALFRENNAAKALKYFEQAPPGADSSRYRAQALVDLDKPDEAIALLQTAIRKYPAAAALHALLGDLLLTQWQKHDQPALFQQAVTAYRAADDSGGEFSATSGIRVDGHLLTHLIPNGRRENFGLLYLMDEKSGIINRRLLLINSSSSYTYAREKAGIRISYTAFHHGWLFGDFFQYQTDTSVIYSAGRFDHPVDVNLRPDYDHYQPVSNFVSLRDPFLPFSQKSGKANPQFPRQPDELEALLRENSGRDPAGILPRFYLGELLWTMERRPEAEAVWSQLLADGAATAADPRGYFSYAWLAGKFEVYGQPEWADRSFRTALALRQRIPLAISASAWQEAGSRPFLDVSAHHSAAGGRLERGYEWLRRSRELSGVILNGDDLAATAWEKHFRGQGNAQAAQREEEFGAMARQHPFNSEVATAGFDLSLLFYLTATISFWLLLIAAYFGASRRASAQPEGAQTPGFWQRIRRFANQRGTREAAGFILLLFLVSFGLNAYIPRYSDSSAVRWINAVLVGSLLATLAGFFFLLIVQFGRLARHCNRQTRIVLLAAFAMVIGCTIRTSRAAHRNILTHTPNLRITDNPESLVTTDSAEARLKESDTPALRYVAACLNQSSGNPVRARELLLSLGNREPRSAARLAELDQGISLPREPLTDVDFFRAYNELPLSTELKNIYQPLTHNAILLELALAYNSVDILDLTLLGVLLQLVFLFCMLFGLLNNYLAPLFMLAFIVGWRRPFSSAPQLPVRSTWWRKLIRGFVPGWVDLQRGSMARGYAMSLLAGLAVIGGIFLWAGYPHGFMHSAGSYSRVISAFPLPTPPGLSGEALARHYFWTFLWATPQARYFLLLLVVAAPAALALHIAALRRLRSAANKQAAIPQTAALNGAQP